MKINATLKPLTAAIISCMTAMPSAAMAEGRENFEIEEIITIGSRAKGRSVVDTPVPVDIVSMETLTNQVGQTDLSQLLQYTVPSFNSNRQAGADESDLVDVATLRGLGPDQTLVLVNGKRRHSSPIINIFGSRGRGSAGVDLNAIPVAAIKTVEVLRDGAAAQYGSDAIAGVINIVLKDTEGLTGTVSSGTFKEGDGTTNMVSVNYGHSFSSGGFLNVSAEWLDRESTDRSRSEDFNSDSIYYSGKIGTSETNNNNIFFNSEAPLGDNGTFYAFGGLNSRDGEGSLWLRGPQSPGTVGNDNSGDMYPLGYEPSIGVDIEDESLTLGYRFSKNEWDYDFSATYGKSNVDYETRDSLNVSLAALNLLNTGLAISPTVFDAGSLEYSQKTFNFDTTRFFSDWLSGGVNIALGLEYREEDFKIGAGEEGSYLDYDGDGGGDGGVQGFIGYRPSDETDDSRTSYGAYLDVEWHLSDRLMIATALRGEDFEDFGNTVNGKVAARYNLSDTLTLRGSTSTGFRAPSLQQGNFNRIITAEVVDGVFQEAGIFNNGGAIAQAAGIPPLVEETSVSFGLGMTWQPNDDITVTLDAYQVSVDDRIVLTGSFSDEDFVGTPLADVGAVRAQFFANAVNTKTKGIDLTTTHIMEIWSGRLNTVLSLNVNKTELDSVNVPAGLEDLEEVFFDNREESFLETANPKTKASLMFNFSKGPWNVNLRTAYFGDVEIIPWTYESAFKYSPKMSTDLSIGYDFSDDITLTVGGSNILDEYPDEQGEGAETGSRWDAVQMGFNGAYYYTRISAAF